MTDYHLLINYSYHFFYQKDAAFSGTDNNEVHSSIQTPNIPDEYNTPVPRTPGSRHDEHASTSMDINLAMLSPIQPARSVEHTINVDKTLSPVIHEDEDAWTDVDDDDDDEYVPPSNDPSGIESTFNSQLSASCTSNIEDDTTLKSETKGMFNYLFLHWGKKNH